MPKNKVAKRTSVYVRLDGKPVAKGRPRISGWSRGKPYVFTPETTRKYEAELKACAKVAMGKTPPLEGPLSIDVRVVLAPAKSWSKGKAMDALDGRIFPTKKPDLDNYVKTAMDALNGVVYLDDSQIVALSAKKVYGESPSMSMEIKPFGD